LRKIAHIINPVIVGESSDLFVAQPITFETMRIARDMARDQVAVELFTAQFPEDRAIVPDDFGMTPDLDRSVLDLGSFQEHRKLPVLKDILDRLHATSDAEYLIYSNVDIALMPHFYVAVNQLLDSGYDALVINRRTITNKYDSLAEIPLMYTEIGETHLGYDCFVFRRESFAGFELAHVCIGAPWIGALMLWNLVYTAERFSELKASHLTFHIGNDEVWRRKNHGEYERFNGDETFKALDRLEQKYGSLYEVEALIGDRTVAWVIDHRTPKKPVQAWRKAITRWIRSKPGGKVVVEALVRLLASVRNQTGKANP